jgi:hypothetical protein
MLHPRDSKGRFTRSFTRVLKPADNRLARKIVAAFSPKALVKGAARSAFFASFGGGGDTSNQQTRQVFQTGQLKAAHRAVRTERAAVDSPIVRAVDAELRPLPYDIEVHRRVDQARFGQVPPQELEGYKVKDAGWLIATLDEDEDPTGIHMRIQVPAGVRAVVVDEERGLLALDRELEMAITSVEPNGRGGWNMDMVVLHRAKRGDAGSGGDAEQDRAEDAAAGAEPDAEVGGEAEPTAGSAGEGQPELPFEQAPVGGRTEAPTSEPDTGRQPADSDQPVAAPASPRPATAEERRRFVDEPELVAFRQPLAQAGDSREYRASDDTWVRLERDGDTFVVSERGVWGQTYPDTRAVYANEDEARTEVEWRVTAATGAPEPRGDRPTPLDAQAAADSDAAEPTPEDRIAEMRALDPDMLAGYVQALKGARLTAVARALGVNRGRVADKRTAIIATVGGDPELRQEAASGDASGASDPGIGTLERPSEVADTSDEWSETRSDARSTTTAAGHRENLSAVQSRAEADAYLGELDDQQLDDLLAAIPGASAVDGNADAKRAAVFDAVFGQRFPAAASDSARSPEAPAAANTDAAVARLVFDSDDAAEAGKADAKAVAQEIYSGAFPGGFSTRVGTVTTVAGSTMVTGLVFVDEDGKAKRVGSFIRGFERLPGGAVAVTHEELKVDNDRQGSGFAAAFNAQAEAWYRDHGIDHVRLLADIDVGAYAWARAGYDFADDFAARKILERVGRVMRLIDADSRIPADRKQEQADLARRYLERAEGKQFGDPDFPTPFEISQLGRWEGAGRDDFWIGKAALWGAAWDGVRPLAREGAAARIQRLDALGQWHNEWSGDVIPRAEQHYDATGHPTDTDLNVHAQDWFADGADEDRFAERADEVVGGSWLDEEDEDTAAGSPSGGPSWLDDEDGPAGDGPAAEPAAGAEATSGADAVWVAYEAAQARAGGRIGDWASLARVRREMDEAGMSREEQDEAIRQAAREPGVYLVPENNQRALTDADRAAALWHGGQEKHLILFERPVETDRRAEETGVAAAGTGLTEQAAEYNLDLAGIEGLAAVVESPAFGTARREQLTGGKLGVVERITLDDGTTVVSKENLTDWYGMDGRHQTDAEQLAFLVAGAVGAPVPAVYRRDPQRVYMEWAEGRLAEEVFQERFGGNALAASLADIGADEQVRDLFEMEDAVRLGLLDMLTGNVDRHVGNWFVTDDGLVGIDHGNSWSPTRLQPALNGSPKQAEEAIAVMMSDGLAAHFVGFDGDETEFLRDNPLTAEDIAELRRRLEELRPRFVKLGREEWLEYSLIVLDYLARFAKGDRSMLR